MSNPRHQRTIVETLVVLFLMSTAAGHVLTAQLGDGIIEPGEDPTAELARAVQNPVADLISVPFQNNTSYDFGPRERTQNVMNIQPVIPLSITDEWIVITRTILPIVSQPSFVRGQDRQNGVGDILFTAFLSPKKPAFGSLIWGVGPVVNLPTASDDRLGAATSDREGRFEIRFTADAFAEIFDAEPDLYLRVFDASGERELLSTIEDVRRNAGRDSWFELEIPHDLLGPNAPVGD